MKKLIIQIPCYNEEEALPIALKALPRKLEGIDTVEWLIIDDGCTDKTVEVAKAHGVDHIISFPNNQGLAVGFMAGMRASIKLGADIIVNTDADNQYDARDIPKLIAPILEGKAEIVIGSRPIEEIQHFSPIKKALQRLGSAVVRVLSRTNVEDAPSGFRAMSRYAAIRMNVFNHYTYTLETIIQAGQKNIAIANVPIRVNEDLRASRLVKSVPNYVRRSILTIFRIFAIYQPLKTFLYVSIIPAIAGTALGIRYVDKMLSGEGGGNIQSLILSGILFSAAFTMFFSGVLAELVGVNRVLLEEIRWKMVDLQTDIDRLRDDQDEDT